MNPEARPLTTAEWQARNFGKRLSMQKWLGSQDRATVEIVEERARRAGIEDLIQVESIKVHPEIKLKTGDQPEYCVVVCFYDLHKERWVRPEGYHLVTPKKGFQISFPRALIDYENSGRRKLPEPDYKLRQA